MKEKAQYDWLDLIRGLAALAVFVGHLRIIFFQDLAPATLNLMGKSVFFLTGFMHISVMIFFVLSGFLIIKSIHESVNSGRWSVSDYAQNRLYRLWVVLIPCLLLGLSFDRIGLEYWSDSLFYSNQWKYFLDQDLPAKLSAAIFFGNVFFVQKILCPTLGSNGALWSLANEFWYYVIFPLMYFTVVKKYNVIMRTIAGCLSIALLFFVGYEITITFPIWLLGGLSYIMMKTVPVDFLRNRWMRVLIVGIFCMSIVLLRVKFMPIVFNNYTIALAFALAIPFLVHVKMNNGLLKTISHYLSNISYTLYLAHLPFIYLLTSMMNTQGMTWNNHNFYLFIAVVLATLLYATLLWYIFERNTKKIRSFVNAFFARRKMEVQSQALK